MIKELINKMASSPTIFIILRKILENNFKGQKRVVQEKFQRNLGENILDIGCGTGEFSVLFDPASYTGVDIERGYIAYASKNYKGKFLVGDATKLPLRDNSFDKIVIIGVLHHLGDAISSKVLVEASRILKPDGSMLVMEDVSTANDSKLIRLLHKLDKGEYIREASEYRALIGSVFKIREDFRIISGICPYQVYILKSNK